MLQALGTWGGPELGARRPTDAVRAHWFALPLLRALEGRGSSKCGWRRGTSMCTPARRTVPLTAKGRPPGARRPAGPGLGGLRGRRPGELSLADAVRDGRVEVTGEGTIAKVLREA